MTSAASARSHTVCVIEDDQAIRETLHTLLEGEGYTVIEAADGQAGCDLLRQSQERLIALVDRLLPRMDGCDLLDLVAHDEDLRARHTFIMITASPKRAQEDCGDTLEELSAPLLPKPFDIDDVLEVVAQAEERISVG